MRSNRSRKKKTRRNKNRRTYRRKSPKKRINRKRYSNKKRTGRRRINRKRRRMLRGGAQCKWEEPLVEGLGLCGTCGELEKHPNHIHEFQAYDMYTGNDNCKECGKAWDHLFHRHAFLADPNRVKSDESKCIKKYGERVGHAGVICDKKESDECHQNIE